jgi:hypothetical protein
MDTPTPTPPARSPALVAIASWLVPGMGYWMIGQRHRSLVIGITVIALFVGGLLVGGIRVLEVPGFNPSGVAIRMRGSDAWIMRVSPWSEIKNKPWSMAQVLAGPLSLFGAAGSVLAAQPASPGGGPIADISHTPVNEAGTLYTSVAGMLNLLAIIDAAYRANKRQEAA